MTDQIESTDDARVENSPLRHQYRVLSEEEKEQVSIVKGLGEMFLAKLEELPQGRETSLARTKIEEAVMWAVKGITK